MIFRTRGVAAGIGVASVALAGMVTQPMAHADDFGLGDVLSDLVASATTAELANHAVDQAPTASASGAEPFLPQSFSSNTSMTRCTLASRAGSAARSVSRSTIHCVRAVPDRQRR